MSVITYFSNHMHDERVGGISSNGRACALHAQGSGIDARILHPKLRVPVVPSLRSSMSRFTRENTGPYDLHYYFCGFSPLMFQFLLSVKRYFPFIENVTTRQMPAPRGTQADEKQRLFAIVFPPSLQVRGISSTGRACASHVQGSGIDARILQACIAF